MHNTQSQTFKSDQNQSQEPNRVVTSNLKTPENISLRQTLEFNQALLRETENSNAIIQNDNDASEVRTREQEEEKNKNSIIDQYRAFIEAEATSKEKDKSLINITV